MSSQASTLPASILVILAGVSLLAMTASGHPFGRHGLISGTVFIALGLFRLGKTYLGVSN